MEPWLQDLVFGLGFREIREERGREEKRREEKREDRA